LFRFRFGWARILGCLDGEECKSCGWAGGEGNKARTLLYWGLHPRIVHSIEVVEDHMVEMIGWLAGNGTEVQRTKEEV